MTMPPRHGKSETCSRWLPCWFLELFPDRRVIMTSFAASLAEAWGRRVRDTLAEYSSRLRVRVSPTSGAQDEWETTAGGGMLAAGVGGGITGRGADLLLIDDPHKDREEADSETMRERAWEWWVSTARTRREPGATVVLIQTRWHEDDLAGRLLAQKEGDEWELISFPAIAEEHDVLGRRPGEALWPERYPVEDLEVTRRVDSREWSAMYQQRPSPAGGSVFRREHFRYFRESERGYVLDGGGAEARVVPRESCWVGQTCDTAMVDKTTADWTVVLTFAVTPARDLLVLDVSRRRLEIPDQLAYLLAQRERWSPVWQGVEDKSSGIGLIQEAARRGSPFRILKADRSKVLRASTAATWFENGMIRFRRDASWLSDFEGELLGFPAGKHDDQVDCLSYAAQEVGRAGPGLNLEGLRRRAERRRGMEEDPDDPREDRDHPGHAAWRKAREWDGFTVKGGGLL